MSRGIALRVRTGYRCDACKGSSRPLCRACSPGSRAEASRRPGDSSDSPVDRTELIQGDFIG